MPRKKKKNIILLIDVPQEGILKVLKQIKERHQRTYKFMLMYDQKNAGREDRAVLKKFDHVVSCNYDSSDSIFNAIKPFQDQLAAAFCRIESQILNFRKVVPHIPYLRTPTTDSLLWSTNKYQMRRKFSAYDKKITPKFMLVKDKKKTTLSAIEKKIQFPLVIKPSGLAQSLLVSVVFHREELEKNLSQVFRKIKAIYKDAGGQRNDPEVLVEQFIEGEMYSIDGYINSRGMIYFCPMMAIKTGKQIGFDDFFGYQQITPTNLSKETIRDAEEVAEKGVRALGLRSIPFHAELLKRDKEWFIVEIGARVGGYRAELYELSYGIKHLANSVDITIPKTPKIPRKIKAHSAFLKFFAKEEGIIKNIKGLKKAQELKSMHTLMQNKKIGDKATYAKNGGKSVFNVIMVNKDRPKLLADIRRLEQMVKIETEKVAKKKKRRSR
ncbi:ATP-grasp domain-containing protein [Candidatus Nomurabacteria bacterium]|nr:ATP-grasp domain-containing protein [Candidatus Nomurabacteria bacterium]